MRILFITGLLAAASVAHGQSLLQLYPIAHDYDAAYQSAQAQAQASQSRADQARAGLLPQLGLQAGAQHNYNQTRVSGLPGSSASFNTLNAGIVASQPLYAPANRIIYDQGQRAADAAQVNLHDTQQDLIVRLASAYFDVLAAQDALTSVRALKAAVSEQLAAAERNFEVGNATITDSREAQARFDLATAQEIASENDLRVKKLNLDQLVGANGINPHPLAIPIELPTLQPDQVAAWVNQARELHPQVVQARMALDIAQLEIDKARAGHQPTVDLQAGLSQTRYPDGNPSFGAAPKASSHATHASVGVVLNWPLFAGFSIENRVKEALALQEQARADLDRIERGVAQATRTAFYGVQSGLSQVRALQAAEHSSLTALEANQLGYEVGVRINIDVLNAQSQLYETQRELARARYDVLVGLLRLKQAAGTLSTDDLVTIDQMLAAG